MATSKHVSSSSSPSSVDEDDEQLLRANEMVAHSPTRGRRKLLQAAPWLFTLSVTIAHVLYSPYTKVEESFELHAVHDFLAYGLRPANLHKWDHLQFPGAVPRSFLPPVALGMLTYPFAYVFTSLGLIRTKLGLQVLVRCVLAFLNASTFAQLALSVRARYGAQTRTFFILLSLSAFHFPYYAGRTLPNFLTTPLVYVAMALIIRATTACPLVVKQRRFAAAITTLTAAATVIRLELALFLFPLTLSLVASGRLSLSKAVKAGAVGGFRGLFLAAPLDYYLWNRVLPHPTLPTFNSTWQIVWPEASSMVYNVIEGGAENWGIMSWHYYLTNSLPKLLGASAALLLYGSGTWAFAKLFSGRARETRIAAAAWTEIMALFGPAAIAMIAGMSLLGHKEWRFIVYVVPTFNILAAITAAYIWDFPVQRLQALARLGLAGLLILNIVASLGMTLTSGMNYPGGDVWATLETLDIPGNSTIHFSSYPLQTGASLFTFLHSPSEGVSPPRLSPTWTYSKDEDPRLLTPSGAGVAGLDYLVLNSQEARPFVESPGNEWDLVREIEGFVSVSFDRRDSWGVSLKREALVAVVGKRG